MQKTYLSTERLTGLFYLGLAITGVVSFLFVGEKVFVESNAVATALNFVEQEGLVRLGIAAELALVAFQALTAMWFYKLFHKIHQFAALMLALFGMVNAIVILIANGMWLSGLLVTTSGSFRPEDVQLLFIMHNSLWVVGQLFFGLWLLPMGYLVGLSRMPQALSWVLLGGGVGYILSVFIALLLPAAPAAVTDSLLIPATIGEFWIIGYMLAKPVQSRK